MRNPLRTALTARRFGAVAATVLLTGALAACGSDSTVDSDADGSSVPSVSSSPTGESSGDSSESSAPSESSGPSRDNSTGGAGGGGSDEPRDGEVNEVEEPPGEAAERTAEDDAFLAELKDNGIDLSDNDIQDQVIAAGREQCVANDEGRDGFAIPMIAGQLEVQELTDVSVEDAQRIITDAAESHYCG